MENLMLSPMSLEMINRVDPMPTHDQLLDCVRRLGSFCSDAILESTTSIFQIDGVDGLIGYRRSHSCAVVYGDPICRPSDWEALVSSFHRYCAENRLSVVYIAVTEAFTQWAHPRHCGALAQFGQELTLDPHNNPQKLTGTRASLVRRKVRHATKEGAIAQEYRGGDPLIEAGIEQVRDRWLAARRGLQIHISTARVFDDRSGKRWFYTQQGGQITGVVVLSQLTNHEGWLLNHLMHTSAAAGGTPELLVTTALEALAKEGCHYVTFGTVTTPVLGEIIGLNKVSCWVSRHLYRWIIRVFHLGNRLKFWEKFHPHSTPLYLLFSRDTIRLRELYALTRALNVGFQKVRSAEQPFEDV